MAHPNKLKGASVAEIAAKVNEDGQLGAALELGVSQSTVSLFLRKHGYRAVTTYLADGETITITDGKGVPFQMAESKPS